MKQINVAIIWRGGVNMIKCLCLYFFNFLFMEIYNPTQYSFSELYLQVLPEWRIRRRQYIGRMVGWGILLVIIFFALIMFLGKIAMMTSPAAWVVNIIFLIMSFVMWYALNTKRMRDIGKDPRLVQRITISLFVWNILYSIYISLWENGFISGYVGSMQQALAEFTRVLSDVNWPSILEFPWHQNIMEYSMYPYGIILLVLFLYLFLIPGKTGDNEFGKDPMGTKLGFFG